MFVITVVVFLVGVVSMSNLRLTDLTETLAGNSIQRGRAMQSAEGGLIEAERGSAVLAEKRVFASSNGYTGIFSKGHLPNHWWRSDSFTAATELDTLAYPGVVDSPEYVTEEIGNYLADGGSGIVSLDRGSAGYGRSTLSGRELILYRLQSVGSGSVENSRAVVESLYVINR